MAGLSFRVRRQASPTAPPRWEGYSLDSRPGFTIADCLAELGNREAAPGSPGSPIAWDGPCEGACRGACALIVNSRPVTACGTRVDSLAAAQIMLEPLFKFVVVQDLIVDRSPMTDAINALEHGAHAAVPASNALASALSRCTQCGICMDACPQVNERSDYVGPAVLAHVLVFNARPDGRASAAERLRAIMGRGGLADCGNAQNCVEVCPYQVPLTDALGELGRLTTALWLKRPFKG